MPKKRVGSTRIAGQTDKEIGNRVRAYRIDRGLSQTDLGQKLDVSFQQIQKYEKGSNKIGAVRLMEISVIFGITPHELLGWNSTLKLGKPISQGTFKLAQEFEGLKPELQSAVLKLTRSLMAIG